MASGDISRGKRREHGGRDQPPEPLPARCSEVCVQLRTTFRGEGPDSMTRSCRPQRPTLNLRGVSHESRTRPDCRHRAIASTQRHDHGIVSAGMPHRPHVSPGGHPESESLGEQRRTSPGAQAVLHLAVRAPASSIAPQHGEPRQPALSEHAKALMHWPRAAASNWHQLGGGRGSHGVSI